MRKLNILSLSSLLMLLGACAAPSAPAVSSCQTLLDDASFLSAYRSACVAESHADAARYDSESYFAGETLFKRQSCLKHIPDAHIEVSVAAAQAQTENQGYCATNRRRAESLLQHYESQKP